MTRARPLRFLVLVMSAWIGARALILSLPVPEGAQAPASTPRVTAARLIQAAAPPLPQPSAPTPDYSLIRVFPYKAGSRLVPSPTVARRDSAAPPAWLPISATSGLNGIPTESRTGSAPLAFSIPGANAPSPAGRWSGSAWLLLRDDPGGASLAPGGTLGGSQIGARLSYRIGGGLALSGRFYLPVRRTGEAEVAAGLDWRPSARLPVHLLAERRQDAGGAGRSAFALTLYGGASGRLPGGLRAEGYGQAGAVGIRSRDLFADGSVRVGLPVGPIEIGGGAWGAAQPGAARLDAGPIVSYRLPVRRANLRLQADWRFRIAGDAAPGSGPALTLAADF